MRVKPETTVFALRLKLLAKITFFMPKQDSRRTILRYSLGKKPVFSGFLGKVNKQKNFFAQKNRHQAHLTRCLNLSVAHRDSVSPMLRSCLVKLNSLPFLYTTDSNKPSYSSGSRSFEFLHSPPNKKFFFYRAPFTSIHVDGSKQSFLFWKKLAELCNKYPKAVLSPPVPCESFEIISSTGKTSLFEPVQKMQLKSKLLEARRFFREVEKIASQFTQG